MLGGDAKAIRSPCVKLVEIDPAKKAPKFTILFIAVTMDGNVGLKGSVKRKREEETSDVNPIEVGVEQSGYGPAEIEALSKTSRELLELDRDLALATVEKLTNAYLPPGVGEKNYQSTALGWSAAETTPSGCILCRKKPSHVSPFYYGGV